MSDDSFVEEVSTGSQNSEKAEPSNDSFKKINDPIHKFISFPRSIWRIIDTQSFQRLRFIKQLGVSSFIFNGANHSRFEHCLGVGHLAWEYLDIIAKNHNYCYEEMDLLNSSHFDKVKLLVTIAGICHDLGHGPFSHLFDNLLLPKLGEKKWKHEEGSCMMFETLLNEPQGNFRANPIKYKEAEFIPDEDKEIIFDMIRGLSFSEWKDKYSEKKQYPRWAFDVISNHTTSIDVDKFDYFKRDSQSLELKHQYDHQTLFGETRIINGEICYNSKMHDDIYDIFHFRYKLYKNIYFHKVAWSIELMLCDAFELAAKTIKFKDIIRDPKQYIQLTDSIVETILYSDEEDLEQSRKIIERILCRDLYRFVGEVVVDQQFALDDKTILEGIINYSESTSFSRTTYSKDEIQQIAIRQGKVNYCKEEQDPVVNVKFFKSSLPYQKKSISPLNSSLLRPDKYGERIFRVYVKNNDLSLINRVKIGFANFTQKKLNKEKRDIDKLDVTKALAKPR